MSGDESRSSLELFYDVSRELSSALELHTVLQRVLFQSVKVVGGERASIVALDDNGKVLDSAIVNGGQIHDNTTQQLRDTIDRGLAGWVIRHHQPAWVPDTSKDERWLRHPDDAADRRGAKAAMCVPLQARERLVGVLTVVHPVVNSYTKNNFDLMQAIAGQAGIAILNARLYEESQRQVRIMAALTTSAAAINASLQSDDVFQRILDETIHALQVETVALAMVDSNGDLVFRAATGKNAEAVFGKCVPAGKGVAGWVAREEQGIIIPDVREDSRFLPDVEQFPGLEVHALACAPIHAEGRLIGILEAINPLSRSFNPEALLVLTGISTLAGSSLQHAQLFERLQAAHRRYHELFDDSVNPILITDLEGIILEANRQAATLSGYSVKELTESKMKISNLHNAQKDEKSMGREATTSGKTVSYESFLLNKSGKQIPIQVYIKRVVFQETQSLQWIFEDISERKELDSLREDMTAMIYHDLRSPLSNVVSSLDVLYNMFTDEEYETIASVLTIASRSTTRIQRLISSLLDINRLESGKSVGTQQAIRPAILLEDALDAVRPMAESRNQPITVNLLPDLPPVWVDVDMIRRVLINLIENASKFSPAEGEIEVGAKTDGDWLQMWVKDSGPGIPLEDQERIFEKYTRLKEKGGPPGLGVGLAFCRLAVEGHGGRIWVESNSNHGASFNLTLPFAKIGIKN